MLTEDLKIVRSAKELLWMVITLRNDMPKALRQGLGDRMQECVEMILKHIAYANRFREPKERIRYLTALLAEHQRLEMYIDFCVQHRLIEGVKRAAQLAILSNAVGKQATGWKGVTERLSARSAG